jgi:hypothetical protein
MKPIPKAGIVLGVLVEIWTYLMGITGWYKDPHLLYVFYVVILIEVGVLLWGLKMTAAQGRGYGAQVGAGTLIAVIGAVIIFIGAYIFTAVVYPNYFTELNEMQRSMGAAQGMTQEQINAQIAMMTPMQTPFVNALTGAFMTVVTGFVASLIIGAFIKAAPATQSKAN